MILYHCDDIFVVSKEDSALTFTGKNRKAYHTRRHQMYSFLFNTVSDTAGGDEVIDKYSLRAISAGLKDFLKESTVEEYVQNNIMEELDLKITEWELSHLKLSLSWLRVWKDSMEPSDIGNNNNMNIQVVEEIDRFREEFDRSEGGGVRGEGVRCVVCGVVYGVWYTPQPVRIFCRIKSKLNILSVSV